MDARVEMGVEVKRCLDGYVWVEAEIDGDRGRQEVLVDLPFVTQGLDPTEYHEEIYQPMLRDSALFQTFARLDVTKEAMLDFANQFGRLTGHGVRGMMPKGEGTQPVWGDTLTEWVFNLVSVKHWVTIWALANSNPRGLLPYMESLPEYADTLDAHGLAQSIRKIDSEELIECSSKDRVAVARRLVCEAAGGHVSRVDGTDFGSGDGLRLKMRFCGKSGGGKFAIVANDLRSAIWLQFAAAVAENKQFRDCQTCGKSFELTPELNRTSRLFCKEACKLKAFRQRKREALRMHEQGRTLRQIADALDSDVPNVRGWIKNRGR